MVKHKYVKQKIKKVILSQEEDISIIYFVNDVNIEDSWMLQFQDELTEEDIKLRWTKYYLGYADGARGNYSCIKSININNKNIEFIFNETGIDTFNINILFFEISQAPNGFYNFLKEKFLSEDVLLNIDDTLS